jgi:nucleoside-diphosphate-sugar epimerase
VAVARTAVVTGASGFIGRPLVDLLRASGWTVTGVDLVADSARGVVAGDVAAPGAWQHALVGADLVVHTAAKVGMPTPPDPDGYWRVNVGGTKNVLDAAARGGARRVVVLSSVVVFGLDFPDGVDEDHPVRHTGIPYTDTKIAAEVAAMSAHAAGGTEVVVVRPGDVYGPGSIWVEECLAMLRQRTFMLPARGQGTFSPVYVDDLVRGLVAAATAPAAAGRTITLSGGVGVPAGDFFDRVAALEGRGPVRKLPTSVLLAAAGAVGLGARAARRTTNLSPGSIHYLADRRGTYSIARAADLLGWRPEADLDEGMARVAAARTRG